jgi:hypothetical protein
MDVELMPKQSKGAQESFILSTDDTTRTGHERVW